MLTYQFADASHILAFTEKELIDIEMHYSQLLGKGSASRLTEQEIMALGIAYYKSTMDGEYFNYDELVTLAIEIGEDSFLSSTERNNQTEPFYFGVVITLQKYYRTEEMFDLLVNLAGESNRDMLHTVFPPFLNSKINSDIVVKDRKGVLTDIPVETFIENIGDAVYLDIVTAGKFNVQLGEDKEDLERVLDLTEYEEDASIESLLAYTTEEEDGYNQLIQPDDFRYVHANTSDNDDNNSDNNHDKLIASLRGLSEIAHRHGLTQGQQARINGLYERYIEEDIDETEEDVFVNVHVLEELYENLKHKSGRHLAQILPKINMELLREMRYKSVRGIIDKLAFTVKNNNEVSKPNVKYNVSQYAQSPEDIFNNISRTPRDAPDRYVFIHVDIADLDSLKYIYLMVKSEIEEVLVSTQLYCKKEDNTYRLSFILKAASEKVIAPVRTMLKETNRGTLQDITYRRLPSDPSNKFFETENITFISNDIEYLIEHVI